MTHKIVIYKIEKTIEAYTLVCENSAKPKSRKSG